MIKGDRDVDTICAISTPIGTGGISVLRVSGPGALLIAQKSCQFLPKEPTSHHVYLGLLRDLSQSKPQSAGITDEAVDEVVTTYFKKGHSFTGDETIEISCHGSPYIAQKILTILVQSGARLAEPGEFTYRAFMNGKLDLVQAEGVLALIQAQSDRSGKQALRQLRGSLSKKLEAIEADILWSLARLEVSIDFSTEDVEIVSKTDLNQRVLAAQQGVNKLLESYRSGRMIKEGLQLVLAGEPNVGKSSLLNLLVEESRAIVSEIAGTTRDLVEAKFSVQGIVVNATDTAGLRKTSDIVESLGIKKSYEAISDADIIFFVFDINRGLSAHELGEIELLDPYKIRLIGNKKDKFSGFLDSAKKTLFDQLKVLKNFQKIENFEPFMKSKVLFVSAYDKSSYEDLTGLIALDLSNTVFEDQSYISQVRHFENLTKAAENIERALLLITADSSVEFMALELKEALILVQETLGKRFDDQVMDRVFREFCIGK